MSTGREKGRVLYKQGTHLHLGAAARQTLERHIALETTGKPFLTPLKRSAQSFV